LNDTRPIESAQSGNRAGGAGITRHRSAILSLGASWPTRTFFSYVERRMATGEETRNNVDMRSRLLLWSPRVLGLLVCVFLSVFGLDAFGNGKTVIQTISEFTIHLAPVLILLAVVCMSWRWPWVGGVVFTGLAAGYAYVSRAHPSWILVIAGPLLTVGMLFLWSWRQSRRAN